MSVRKLMGWLLVVVGAARVFQAIYLQAAGGQGVGVSQAAIISLLLSGGAALLWLSPVRPTLPQKRV